MLDESGFSLLSPLKRTWSRRGQTPTVRTSLLHHERLNLLGALCMMAGGRLIKWITRAHRRSLRGEEVIAFLKTLLARFAGSGNKSMTCWPIPHRVIAMSCAAT